MYPKPKTVTLVTLMVLLFTFTGELHAGVSDIISRAGTWWKSGSIRSDVLSSEVVASEDQNDDEDEDEEDEDEEGDDNAPGGRLPGMCRVPQQPALMRCEIGSGFLCVDTPPGGVDGDSVRIRGTIDRSGSVFASIRIAVQNEYTKKLEYVDTADPRTSDCWDETAGDDSFCIDSEGFFSASVPLRESGPYTVSMSASRLSGESVEKRVRTSRVVAPVLNDNNVSFDPDVKSSKTMEGTMVTVTIELLGECNFCDFIGASTGGVTVSIENTMTDSSGDTKQISCPTTVEQGGQGRFVIGVPVGPGKNSITVSVCNDATGSDCPALENISFTATGEIVGIETISPPPRPIYDSDEYHVIPWEFRTSGGLSCVELRFNREEPRELCAGADGLFSVDLAPRKGINVATLASADGTDQFAWTFGWGGIRSPFADEASSIEVPDALGLAVSGRMIGDILVPFMNNFLASDEFDSFIMMLLEKTLGGDSENGRSDPGDEELPDVEAPQIPECDTGGGLGEYLITLGGIPTIGGIRLSDFSLNTGSMNLSLVAENLKIRINLSPDEDGDAKADKDPLPLIISFETAKFDISLTMDKDGEGRDILLLSSPYDDCNYKDSSYCKEIPSSLVPKNFKGNATSWGNFVRCDENNAGSEAKEACNAINSINAQTGVISEMVLDAINSAVYCGGSRALTGMMRDYVRFPVQIGCVDEQSCEGVMGKLLPSVKLPLGVKLGGGTGFSSSGLFAGLSLSAGDKVFFDSTPGEFHIPDAGVVVDGDAPGDEAAAGSISGYDIGASISLDAVNAILYALIAHGDGYDVRGFLDFDIHEQFFNNVGFDFVEECDAFEAIPGIRDTLPTLCYLRPRVMELLGSSLTTYGYFPGKQPLIMALRGSRALAPRLVATTVDKIPVVPRTGDIDFSAGAEVPDGNLVELQLGGVELSFYAIELDETQSVNDYGNLPIKFDSDGKPVIHSMLPDDPDPWKGPIVSFDVTLLLGLEIGDVEADPEADSGFVIRVRTLADRSRLILTPIEGSNVTTIPSRKLISNLADQLMTALSMLSPKESAIAIPVPRELAFENADDGGLFSLLGLRKISMGSDGLSLAFDHESNSISILLKAIIEQVVHVEGEELRYVLPD